MSSVDDREESVTFLEHVQVAGAAEGTKAEASTSAASPAKVTETKVSDLLQAADPQYVDFSMT